VKPETEQLIRQAAEKGESAKLPDDDLLEFIQREIDPQTVKLMVEAWDDGFVFIGPLPPSLMPPDESSSA
jgi:hypothetical protein